LQRLIDMANASPFLHLPLRQLDQAFSCQTVTAFAEPFLSTHRKPARRDPAGEFAGVAWVILGAGNTWPSVVSQATRDLFVVTHSSLYFFDGLRCTPGQSSHLGGLWSATRSASSRG
jgi:hypothetical protein